MNPSHDIILGLFRASVGLTMAALVVGLLVRILRLRAPRIEQWAWTLVLLQGIVLVPLTAPVPAHWLGQTTTWMQGPSGLEPNEENISTPEPPGQGAALASSPPRTAIAAHSLRETNMPSVKPASAQPPRAFPWLLSLFWVWTAGVASLLAVGIIRYASFCRTVATAAPLPGEWEEEWRAVTESTGGTSQIRMVATKDLGPALVRIPSGYRIVVPHAEWKQLTSEQRSAILRHELAHFQRGDLWTGTLARGVGLLHWFNPVAWWAVRQFEAQLEFACDQAAAGKDPTTFAAALLQMGIARSPRMVPAQSARTGNLGDRMRRLLAESPNTSVFRRAMLIAVALLALAPAALRVRGVAQVKAAEPVTGARPEPIQVAVEQPKPREIGKENDDKKFVDAQLKELETADDRTRTEIYSALSSSDDPRIEQLFLEGLNDRVMSVRWRSISGLGRLKSKVAVEPLLRMLDVKDRSCRTNAARALAEIGDRRALESLARIARTDLDLHVQDAAGRALADLEHGTPRDPEIAWGNVVDGMQLGLQCRSGDEPHRYGEAVTFQRYARNLGPEPWTIEIGSGGIISPWVKGDKVRLHSGLHVSGVYSVHRVTVPAKSTVGLDTATFILLPEKQQAAGYNASLSVKPGTYAITTNLANFMAWSDPSVDIKLERIWRTDLVTGQLKFVVREDPK